MKLDRYSKVMLTLIAVSLTLLTMRSVIVPLVQPDDAAAARLLTATQHQFGTSGVLGGGLFFTTSPGEPWDINLYEAKSGRIFFLGNFNYGWRPAEEIMNKVKGKLDE